jgi:hypothetical protein
MTKTFDAIFDGKVLRPENPLDVAPNTRVRVTIETTETGQPSEDLRPFGLCRGEFMVPEDFNAPLPANVLADFVSQ